MNPSTESKEDAEGLTKRQTSETLDVTTKSDDKSGPKLPSWKDSGWRWLFLAFLSFTHFGASYCYESITTIQTPLMIVFNISNAQYGVIYSVGNVASILSPIFAGIFVDKFGIAINFVFWGIIVLIGQFLCGIGARATDYATLLIGRTILGMGAESLSMIVNLFAYKWFKKREFGLAIGVGISFNRIGASLASTVTASVFESTKSIPATFWTGLYFALGSFVFISACSLMDSMDDKRTKTVVQLKDEFKWADFKSFSKLYWILVISNCLGYFLAWGFLTVAVDLMFERFQYSLVKGAQRVATFYAITVIGSPLFGFITDKRGKRPLFFLISVALIGASHLILFFTPDVEGLDSKPDANVWASIILMGMYFSIYAGVFWPCISIVAQPETRGLAYGLIQGVQNGFLATGIPLLGLLHDRTEYKNHGYYYPQLVLLICTALALVVNLFVKKEDKVEGGKLQLSTADIARLNGDDDRVEDDPQNPEGHRLISD